MKRVKDLTGAELQAWQADYPQRERVRAEIGRGAIEAYAQAFQLSEPERQANIDFITRRAVWRGGAIAAAIPEIMIKEFQWAAAANRGVTHENLDVTVYEVSPDQITPQGREEECEKLVKDWGDKYRIPPPLRESYLREISAGERIILVADAGEGEAAGRVSLIPGGPVVRTSPDSQEPPEFAGKPSEPEVWSAIGRDAPWMEDLAVMEGFRGGGIGIRLILEFEQLVRQSKVFPQKVALSVQPDNKKAISMYENNGYEHIVLGGEETFISHIGEPPRLAQLMVKDLS